MTYFQAQQIINSQIYVDAVLQYRRDPIATDDRTFRRAQLWLNAANLLAQS